MVDDDATKTQSPPVTVTESSPTLERGAQWEDATERSRSRISDKYDYPTPDRAPRKGPGGKIHPGKEFRGGKHHRPRSPGLKWHKDYCEINPQWGRVLLIDFAKNENVSHVRKVAAQEIYSLEGLKRAYSSQDHDNKPILRVIHVQNAQWATRFLLHKFNIQSNRDDIVGSDFGRYLRYKRPEKRGGKPFLNGKSWKVQYDPWRGVSKTSFGLDYVKTFGTRDPATANNVAVDQSDRLMQLNSFDDNDEPICGYDIYVQRVSCYIQHKQDVSDLNLEDFDIQKNYYPDDKDNTNDDFIVNGNLKDKDAYDTRLRNLDNGNVIIIFDNSHSGSMEDTLIAARREWECRWRRLPFYLAFESREALSNEEQLSLQCTKSILSDIFKAVVMAWDGFLDHAVTHMSILEDKIYDQPADETRAPELWSNSSLWLKVEKLLNVHASVVHEMKSRLHELTEDVDSEDNWLEDSPGDFERLNNLVEEDLTKPTESLISLLYQSVSIRDSRHSLELGASMWRLSWITFIFLPLTFIVGFFGMNVDTFSNNPSIKWYFIAAIPFMVGVVAFYFMMKRIASKHRQASYERGVYENFFQDMAIANPTLWSRTGPRDYVIPQGRIARLKWSLIRSWSKPERTIRMNVEDDVAGGTSSDSLGTVSRIQRYLSRRWTEQISRSAVLDTELGLMDDYLDGGGDRTIGDGLVEVAEILGAPAAPAAGQVPNDANRLTVPGTIIHAESPQPGIQQQPPANTIITAAMNRQYRRSNSSQRGGRGRSSSSGGRNSGVLVEEEDAEWLHERGKEGKDWVWRNSSERERQRKKEEEEEEEKEKEKEKKNQKNKENASLKPLSISQQPP